MHYKVKGQITSISWAYLMHCETTYIMYAEALGGFQCSVESAPSAPEDLRAKSVLLSRQFSMSSKRGSYTLEWNDVQQMCD